MYLHVTFSHTGHVEVVKAIYAYQAQQVPNVMSSRNTFVPSVLVYKVTAPFVDGEGGT